jgi:xylanolytic transcriptional activator XlnR
MILSSAMHQFPPNGFTPLPSSSNLIGSPTTLDPHHHHHQNGAYAQHNQSQIPNKKRQHPYGTPSALSSPMSPTSASASGPIRRRISRACDQCNQLRTKCDGKLPCQHCIGEFVFIIFFFVVLFFSEEDVGKFVLLFRDTTTSFGGTCEYL